MKGDNKMKYIDLHCDTLSRLLSDGASLAKSDCQVDLEKLEKGGCAAQFFAMFVPTARVEDPYKICLDMLANAEKEFAANTDRIALCRSYADLEKANAEGKVGAFLTVEDSGIFECDIEKMHHLYDHGLRLVTITWNFKNIAGSPNFTPEMSAEGLTAHGIEMVEEMERLGIIPDASHLSDGGFWSLVENCKKPFVASHSNARAVASVTRNLTDEMLKALANKGGVTGLNYLEGFVTPRQGDMFARPERPENPEDRPKCTLEDLTKHATHILNVAGEDVLALGSDFDGINSWPEGLDDASCVPLVADAFKKAGITERVIEKIFYTNAARVIKDCIG